MITRSIVDTEPSTGKMQSIRQFSKKASAGDAPSYKISLDPALNAPRSSQIGSRGGRLQEMNNLVVRLVKRPKGLTWARGPGAPECISMSLCDDLDPALRSTGGRWAFWDQLVGPQKRGATFAAQGWPSHNSRGEFHSREPESWPEGEETPS